MPLRHWPNASEVCDPTGNDGQGKCTPSCPNTRARESVSAPKYAATRANDAIRIITIMDFAVLGAPKAIRQHRNDATAAPKNSATLDPYATLKTQVNASNSARHIVKRSGNVSALLNVAAKVKYAIQTETEERVSMQSTSCHLLT